MKTKTKKRKPLKSLAHIKRLSTLLALGLRDLRKQERAKNSEVVMFEWLKRNGVCQACLAGSVMRFSLRMRGTCFPIDTEENTEARLWSLNNLRFGQVFSAARRLGIKTRLRNRDVPAYHDDPKQWWSEMRQLLKDLRAAGE